MKLLHLRAMEPEDLELLYKVENDVSIWGMGPTTMPYSRDVLRQYILSTTGDIFIDKQVRLIIETDGGTTVGIADINSFDAKHMRAEVGIVILPEYRNMGYATQAIQLLADYSLNTIHLHQLYAIVPCSNSASKKVFEKCGFYGTMELKDWLFDGKKYKNALLLQKIL